MATCTPFAIHWIYSGTGFIDLNHKGAKIANQQFARSRERHPEIDVVRAFGHVLRAYGGTTGRYLTMITAQLYRSLCREHMRLYDDTFWTLNEFRKRYRLGIVSDAQRIFCNPELRTLRLENFFDAIVISSDYGFRKPDPRIFHMALAILDVPASEAVYIGNTYKTDLRLLVCAFF